MSYTYCVGTTGCAQPSDFTKITTSQNFPVSVDTSSLGLYRITFKGTDALKHQSTLTYDWERVNCLNSETRSIAVTQGTRAQSCGSNGDWVDGAISCNANHGMNADSDGCLTCGAGEYLVSGACQTVQGGYVSAVNTVGQTPCTGSTIPDANKSACISNACDIEDGANKVVGAGTLSKAGGSCHLVSCIAGYYEKAAGTCSEVEVNSGYYSAANDQSITQCSVSMTLPDHATWTNKVRSAVSGDCTWDCKSSWKKDSATCVGPSVAGKYIDSGVEKDCGLDGSLAAPTGGGVFVPPAGGRTMAQSCDFTCSGSKVKNTADRSCDTAGTGKFIVSGLEKSCATGSNMDLASRKGSKWASSQPGIQTAANCKLATCSGTHVFTDTSKTRCRALITGEYQKTDHTEGSCVAIANSQFTSDGGASDTGCTYTCTAGFVDGRHDNPRPEDLHSTGSRTLCRQQQGGKSMLCGTKGQSG